MPNWTPEELAEQLKSNPDVTIQGDKKAPAFMHDQQASTPKSSRRHKRHPERDFQNQLIKLAKRLGYIVHAERPARTRNSWVTPIQGSPGFPDIFLVHILTKVRVWIECKSETGRVSPQQDVWITLLKKSGETVFIWKPQDCDFAFEVLTKLAGKSTR